MGSKPSQGTRFHMPSEIPHSEKKIKEPLFLSPGGLGPIMKAKYTKITIRYMLPQVLTDLVPISESQDPMFQIQRLCNSPKIS